MDERWRAWELSSPGKLDATLHPVDRSGLPSPGEGQVLVKVAFAGINPADYKVPELGIIARVITRFPKTPGMDLAGVVVTVGNNVSSIRPGDRVIGRMDPTKQPGTLSEYAVLPVEALALASDALDLASAAGAPTAALTAYQTIAPYVKAGDKVFINGGSGGTGTFGIQIAKVLGCHVTVTCSSSKKELCRRLGADFIIDYTEIDVIQSLRGLGQVFNLIVDNVGNSPPNLYSESHRILKPKCPYVFVGGAISFASAQSIIPARILPSFLGGAKRDFITFITKTSKDDLDQLARWLGEQKLRTVVFETFGFDEAPEAYNKLKEGSVAGKIIIKVDSKTGVVDE